MPIIRTRSKQPDLCQKTIHTKKTGVIFQPHTYTRTKALLPEFAEALTLADHVVLANIYAARETDTLGISSADLQKRIQELGTPCEYFPTFDEIENYLLENCQPGDLLITMGAGDDLPDRRKNSWANKHRKKPSFTPYKNGNRTCSVAIFICKNSP